MSDTARLEIELKSTGAEVLRREMLDIAVFSQKSAKESAAVFIQAYEDRDQASLHWYTVETDRLRDVNTLEQRNLAAFKAGEIEKQAALRQTAALAKETAIGQRDSHVQAYYQDQDKLEREYLAAKDARAVELATAQKIQSTASAIAWKKEQAEKILAAETVAAAEKEALAEVVRAELLAAEKKILLAKEVEAVKILAARKAAAEEKAASAGSSNHGMRVAMGAVAGQRLSVGGLVSVNPYLAAGAAGAFAIKNISENLVEAASKWERFDRAIADTEGSATKAKVAIADLYELAKRPGLGLEGAEAAYLRLRNVGVEAGKTKQIISAFSNANALSGGTSQDFKSSLEQMVQMLGAGKVAQKDLKIMEERMPNLSRVMQDTFGTAIAAGINKLHLNAKQFLDMLLVGLEKLPTATQTLESAMINAGTAWSRLEASFVNVGFTSGVLENWTGMLEGMTKLLNGSSLDWVAVAKGIFINTFRPDIAKEGFESPIITPEMKRVNEIDDVQKRIAELKGMSDLNYAVQTANIFADKGRRADGSPYGDKDTELSELKAKNKQYYDEAQAASKTKQADADKDSAKIAADKAKETASKAIDDAENLRKATEGIRLENAKLNAELKGSSVYEQQRLEIVGQYKIKIAEAGANAAKLTPAGVAKVQGLLVEQRNLKTNVLDKNHDEDRIKTLAAIEKENDKLTAQNEGLSDADVKRNELADSYDEKIRIAIKQKEDEKAIALEYGKILAIDLVTANQNVAVDKATLANAILFTQNASDLGEFDKAKTVLALEYLKTLKETKDITLHPAIDAKFKIDRDALKSNSDKAGEGFRLKYDSTGLEQLKAQYDAEAKLIEDATYSSEEEKARIKKQFDAQYLLSQQKLYADVASIVANSGQSLFSDLASSVKQGIDYRYTLEKNNIDKTYSTIGLSGKALVAQQANRDKALQQLDDNRAAQMRGTYLTMFMISKGFALAEAGIKLSLAIAQAAASGPFPANLAAMAAVAAAVGSVVSNIAAINYAGAFDKGGDIPAGSYGMAGENGLEFIKGPAHVTSTKDTAALLGGSGKAPVVNVMNYSGQNVKVEQGSDPDTINIMVGQIAKQVESQLTTGIRSGRGELQGAIKETFGLTRKGY